MVNTNRLIYNSVKHWLVNLQTEVVYMEQCLKYQVFYILSLNFV